MGSFLEKPSNAASDRLRASTRVTCFQVALQMTIELGFRV